MSKENKIPEKELIFFIESHPLEEPVQILLSEKNDEAGELKAVLAKEHALDKRLKFKYTIYNFEIYPSKINLKEKKKPEFSIKLTFLHLIEIIGIIPMHSKVFSN